MLRCLSITTGLCLLFALWQPADAQHLSWRNYTADEGLPGNEVYDMLQDSRGYLWFVTDQGICRFNGYEFTRPVDTSALRGSEAFLPTEGPDGKIWFTRLDGSVWFIENDTVRAWPHNAVTAPYREEFRPVEKMAINQDGEVWLAIFGLGFLVVDSSGRCRVLSDAANNAFLFAYVKDKLIYTSDFRINNRKHGEGIEVLHWENNDWIQIEDSPPCLPVLIKDRGIGRLNNDDWIYFCQGAFFFIHKQRIVWSVKTDIWAEKIYQAPDGSILIAAHQRKNIGLFYFASLEHLQKGAYSNLLPGRFVTDVLVDPAGGWWATTHHAGVFYCKNSGMDVFDTASGLPSDEVACLTNDGATTVFAGMRPVDIVALDRRSGKHSILARPPVVTKEVQAIFYDALQQRLWCSDQLHYFEHNKWTAATSVGTAAHRSGNVLAKKITPDLFENVLWSSATYGFFKTDARTGMATQLGGTGTTIVYKRTFSVTPDRKGNVWITTPEGLRRWHNGAYELPPFDHPALRFQPRDIVLLPDDGMAISLRGAGVLIRDKQGVFIHLTRTEGLTSDFITKLYAAADGVVFACSPAGLNRLTPNTGGGWSIKIVSVKEGLPSNQVNDVMTFAGDTWVATNRGLARFRNLPAPAPMPAPELEQLLINNRPALFTPALRLAHHENNLSIRFFALHYRSEGDILYRYRLSGTDTSFTNIRTREVNFANLSPGNYTFEVQAQNEDGAWSEPTHWTFCIRAAWWQTVWFWSVVAALSAGGLALWYRSRLQLARREAETRGKIRDLESAALRAQMNPHFIFNCLGSIQYFISENDADAATRYLARFARLVRLALHGSVDGRHSLREETEMLDNYLALEQLRFRGRFTYTIETDPDLDIDDISLPPMLLQPFVENALLHGMKNKTEGGRIAISFSEEAGTLVATVTDNGPGFATDGDQATEGSHKSVGMMLTQRRLEVLSDRPGEKTFLRENIIAVDGTTQGTRVVLRITTPD